MIRRGLLACALPLSMALASCAGQVITRPAQAGRVITWRLPSSFVGPAGRFSDPPGLLPPPSALPVRVYLPDGYDGRQRFPVLYLLHGHGDNYSSWLDPHEGDILPLIRHQRMIVVMPEADEGWYLNWWNGGRRAGPAWERYYFEQLIPFVTSHLRILPGRSNHAIAGLSMGGGGALYIAEQLPGYFGAAASFSGDLSIQRPEWPAMFHVGRPGPPQDYTSAYGPRTGFYATGHNPSALVDNLTHTRILVRVGDGVPNRDSPTEIQDSFGQAAELVLRRQALDFVAAARRAGVDVTFQPHQGIHDWTSWHRDFIAALRWGFFGHVVERPSAWTYATVSKRATAWGYTFTFEHAPTVVEMFTFKHCVLTASGSGRVTVTHSSTSSFRARLPFRQTHRHC